MNKFESYIFDKYYEANYKKYRRIMDTYHKVTGWFRSVPRFFASTYLCWKYPFLKFDVKSGFFQGSCYYWCIEKGWRKAFGLQLCKEIKDALKRSNFLKSYQISDVKEKYGALNIYDDGAPDEVHDIILKYEYISSRTCIKCGRRAKYISHGWIEPYCEDCVKDQNCTSFDESYKDFDWYSWTKN